MKIMDKMMRKEDTKDINSETTKEKNEKIGQNESPLPLDITDLSTDRTDSASDEDEGISVQVENVKSTEDKLELKQKEIDDLKDKNLRIMAEFENFRKRTISEKSSWIKNSTERLVIELCDVIDNFERAINLADEKHEFVSLFDGIKLIYQQMENLLKKEGLKKIEVKNNEFDPKYHEALAHIPSELNEGVIAAVIQNGYIMNDKIIRPAKVAVSNGQKPKQPISENK